MGEFDLIERFFRRPGGQADLGIGDDCALLSISAGHQLATSSDMLVQGQHFFPDVDPNALGHKALAVNLSDLAACGARPLAFTLALSLPHVDEVWLAAFSKGLFGLAEEYHCELVGGDTTKGPLTICITVFGEVPRINGISQALLRSGAQVGDDIYVSGELGDARFALEALKGKDCWPVNLLQHARKKLERPIPRVKLGMALRGLANSAIDLSDGLAGDLMHLITKSGVGARVHTEQVLRTMSTLRHTQWPIDQTSKEVLLAWVLSGGDDYELLFTASPRDRESVTRAAVQSGTPVTCIGDITNSRELQWINGQGVCFDPKVKSFNHFI
tara:strand:- start:71 stop:1057 length:987 start_codon:yes stop_codon:yes gene_type:complete